MTKARDALRRLLDNINPEPGDLHLPSPWLVHEARAALAEEEREEGELVSALQTFAALLMEWRSTGVLPSYGRWSAADDAAATVLAKHPSPPKAGDDR